MKGKQYGTTAFWNIILVISVIFASFIMPVLPIDWQRVFVRIMYSVIYISALFALEKRSNYLLGLFITTLLLEWISGILDITLLLSISKVVNVLFFFVIVGSLIRQIATARQVTVGVILGSIAGYLLLGIIYSLFVTFILQHDPGAFSARQFDASESGETMSTSVPLYISFVTLASLGYGDIVPIKPYTRSLTTFVTVSGQFYIAIIVALLVGKFSAQRGTQNKTH
ncbi:MAG: ion channel [Bacteroidota bacterium]